MSKKEKKSRVLASVCGIGLGHSTRVFSVLEKLKRRANISVVASKMSHQYLKDKGYNPKKILEVDIHGDDFTINSMSSIMDNLDFPIQFMRNYPFFSNILDKFDPDVILSDTEPSSFLISKIRQVNLVSMTNYVTSLKEMDRFPKNLMTTDLKTQHFVMQKVTDAMMKYSDLTLNINIDAKQSLSKSLKNIGLVIRKQPEELNSEPYIKRTLKKDDFYLVSFGGSPLGTTLLEPMLKVLKKFDKKKFIISSSYKVKKIQRVGNITVMPFIDNYLEHLKVCNGVISLAGFSTISETLAYKKPSLVIPIKNHLEQMLNAHMLERLGLANTCSINEGISNLERKMRAFFRDEDRLKQNIQKARIDSKGADEAADIILKMK